MRGAVIPPSRLITISCQSLRTRKKLSHFREYQQTTELAHFFRAAVSVWRNESSGGKLTRLTRCIVYSWEALIASRFASKTGVSQGSKLALTVFPVSAAAPGDSKYRTRPT